MGAGRGKDRCELIKMIRWMVEFEKLECNQSIYLGDCIRCIHRSDPSFNPPFACKYGLLLFVAVDEDLEAFTILIAVEIATL